MDKDDTLNKLEIDSTIYDTRLTRKFLNRKSYEKNDPLKLTAYIPGVIKKLFVHEGSTVNPGDQLLILEAMKMENTVKASFKGKIKKVYVKEGISVMKNQLLIEFE